MTPGAPINPLPRPIHYQHREHRINSFLQNIEKTRMARLDKDRNAAETSVRGDLTNFEERLRDVQTGNLFGVR